MQQRLIGMFLNLNHWQERGILLSPTTDLQRNAQGFYSIDYLVKGQEGVGVFDGPSNPKGASSLVLNAKKRIEQFDFLSEDLPLFSCRVVKIPDIKLSFPLYLVSPLLSHPSGEQSARTASFVGLRACLCQAPSLHQVITQS